MDVFVPKHRHSTRTPAVLWIHGGWERGDKNGNSGVQLLAAEGLSQPACSTALKPPLLRAYLYILESQPFQSICQSPARILFRRFP
jgi:hypothetical protein